MGRKIAIAVFYDQHLNILVQERRSHAKMGEKYGFFGGGIEEGETPEQGLRRELREELDYSPDMLKYWGRFSFEIFRPEGKVIRFGELFLSPITPELMQAQAEDDTAKVLLPIDRIINNTDNEFGPVRFTHFSIVKQDLKGIVKKDLKV